MKQELIIIQTGGGLEQYYNHANHLLYSYYQDSPTSLIDIPIGAQEQGDIAYYNTLVEQMIPEVISSPHTPIGKLVV